jgi:pimeloyl-ACP methyl ester carboxylesterase
MNSMSHYIDLRGHAVWTSEWANNGDALLLLHGGLSATEDFDTYLLPAVEGTHHVFAYDRTAHGRTGDRPGSLHFEFQRDEAIQFLEDFVKGPAHLIGYSDGGIIALLVALKRPELVKSIVAIGTNYHYNYGGDPVQPWEPSDEDRLEHKLRSPDAPESLDSKNERMRNIWNSEPTLTKKDLEKIVCPTLILAGDDEGFSFEHTTSMYEALPYGQLAIIPGTSHHSLKEKPELVQMVIRGFLVDLTPPVTRQPFRRYNENFI